MRDNYEYIFEEFKTNNPYILDDVIGWEPKGTREISVSLKNGSKIIYDNIFKTTRHLSKDYKHELISKDIWAKNFACRLYRAIFISGISQKELSDKTGISQVSISRYIAGDRIPNLYTIDILARALNCNIEDLIDF